MSGSKQKNSNDVAGTAQKHQAITMETKVNIIERVEQGKKVVKITYSYNMNHSVLEHVTYAMPMMLTVIPKKCGQLMEEMEKLLSMWMQGQCQLSRSQFNADARES